MKYLWALLVVVAVGTVVSCEPAQSKKTDMKPITSAAKICAKCGQIKGTTLCCAPAAATCKKCDLVKGSPGCCKLSKGTKDDVLLCATCGQIKGTDLCCKAGAATCAKCKLAKGSPSCCRIK